MNELSIRGPRERAAAWTGLALCALTLSGCDLRNPLTMTPEPTPVASPAASTLAFNPPPWFWGSLPSEAQAVWSQCSAAGTAAYAGTPYVAGINCRLVDVDGYPRRFVVYVSTRLALPGSTDIPVVLMHHGSSGSGEQFLSISGWREEAEQGAFVAAFPTGLEYRVLPAGRRSTKWNSFGLVTDVDTTVRAPHYPPTAPMPADDVKFANLVLDDLSAQLAVDPHRLYAAGFSNGAEFTARLAVEASDRLAAVGVFAGGLTQEYQPLARIPVKLGVGTLDDRVIAQVNGSLLPGQDSITALPLDADSIIQYGPTRNIATSFALTFDLVPSAYVTGGDNISTSLDWTTPQPGNGDGNVFEAAVLDSVTHQYPRGTGRTRAPNNPHAFDATRVFWAFFVAHPRP